MTVKKYKHIIQNYQKEEIFLNRQRLKGNDINAFKCVTHQNRLVWHSPTRKEYQTVNLFVPTEQ